MQTAPSSSSRGVSPLTPGLLLQSWVRYAPVKDMKTNRGKHGDSTCERSRRVPLGELPRPLYSPLRVQRAAYDGTRGGVG